MRALDVLSKSILRGGILKRLLMLTLFLGSALLLLSGWMATMSSRASTTSANTKAVVELPVEPPTQHHIPPATASPPRPTPSPLASFPPLPVERLMDPDEAPITVENHGGSDYIRCMRRYLMLTDEGLPKQRTTDMLNAIPLLITPFTSVADTRAFPSLACSINVPVRYHYIVVNARSEKVRAFVEELTQAFGDVGRLFIQYNKLNMGYAGSMNQGLRWGMEEHTNAEIPWAVMANNDVELGPHVLPNFVRIANKQAAADAPVLAALQAEVQQEQLWAAEGNLTYYHTYVPPGRPLVVLREGAPGVPKIVRTSALLPDRLRYQRAHSTLKTMGYNAAENRPFKGHAGFITAVPSSMPFMALTRLLLSTVGYLDENFYPAYMEDIDLRWRAFALGFHSQEAAGSSSENYRHVNGVNLIERTGVQETELNSDTKAYLAHIGRARGKGEYARLKYGDYESNVWGEAPQGSSYSHIFFNSPYYPVDVWVHDAEFRACFFEREWQPATKKFVSPQRCRYNLAKITTSGAVTSAQHLRITELMSNRTIVASQ